MKQKQKEIVWQSIGFFMFIYLFSVINFVDLRFVKYFSCFAFALIALGFMMKLQNEFLNQLTLSYLIVSIYLLARQAIWISQYGIDPGASFTYQQINAPENTFPFWVHILMHGIPIPLVIIVMFEKKMKVNWKYFIITITLLAAWSYTMDAERFIFIADFWIAYPLGIPLTFLYLYLYDKFILPYITRKTRDKNMEK
ncbi:MAG: hypothetical protein ACTSWN_07415 [Promethearchaeota archaeon]